MKKFLYLILFLVFTANAYSQKEKDILTAKTRAELVHNLDSAMWSKNFITQEDAEAVLGKTVFLKKDSDFIFRSGVLRFDFEYIAKYVDSTSIGKLGFEFQQYKDTLAAKGNYDFIKKENEKDPNHISYKDLGNYGFLIIDSAKQPMIIALKNNKIFKFNITYLTSEHSVNELLQLSKKVIDLH